MILGTSIIPYNKNKKILLQHRTDDAPSYPGTWCFFGGKVEENETPIEGVKRECYEELEYELKNPKLVLEKEMSHKTLGIIKQHIFIEEYDENQKLKLKEGKDMRWFSIPDVYNLNAPGFVKEMLKEIEPNIINL